MTGMSGSGNIQNLPYKPLCRKIIDLNQEINSGMPVFEGFPEVWITPHVTHEEWEGIENSETATRAVLKMVRGEHTWTHAIAINPGDRPYK